MITTEELRDRGASRLKGTRSLYSKRNLCDVTDVNGSAWPCKCVLLWRVIYSYVQDRSQTTSQLVSPYLKPSDHPSLPLRSLAVLLGLSLTDPELLPHLRFIKSETTRKLDEDQCIVCSQISCVALFHLEETMLRDRREESEETDQST